VVRREPGYNPGPTVLADVVARACRDRAGDCADAEQQVEQKATQLVDAVRVSAKQVLNTVAALSNGLARLPGRKTVVLMTDGFFVEDSWAELRAVVERTARASVRLYALDTRGLNRGSASSDILSSASSSQPEMSVMSAGDTNADGPNSLAIDTGGYVIRNENDFGKALSEIDRDTSSYYIVGFRLSHQLDGKYHELKVRVKRGGVTVRARKGYVASADAPVTPLAGSAQPAEPARAEARPAALPAEAGVATVSSGAVRLKPRSASEIETMGDGAVSPRGRNPLPAALRKRAADGWTAYQRGDLEEARTLLRNVALERAAPAWVHYVLGWSQLALGEAAAAAVSWEKVRSAVPEFEPVYFDLASAYQRQGEFARAVGVMRDGEARWPKDVEVYSALGVIQLARGAVDDAIATFAKGVEVAPADANVCYNLAKTYEVRYVRGERLRKAGPGSGAGASVAGDRARAIELYQKVVVVGGPLAEQAREGLGRLSQ
jgi:tetratricopeptide (TPR) repeat protein